MFGDCDINLGTMGYVGLRDMLRTGICLGTVGYVWGLRETFGDYGVYLCMRIMIVQRCHVVWVRFGAQQTT